MPVTPAPVRLSRPLRVAVVGAGPAGIYAAEALATQDAVPVAVDVVDRLPTPFGLVRHGIAPDHPRMRALRDTLRRTLDHERVRFVGNVDVGVDISLAELRTHVDAVVYTYGASRDRPLGVPGEELPGSLAATEVVAWYTGHPDADRRRVEEALVAARDVVVVGMGNVALDVARVLSRGPGELAATDMPQHVLDALAAAPVQRVTVLGRRGPAQASFTTVELRELAHLEGARVVVDAGQLALAVEPTDRVVSRNLAVLRGWADTMATQNVEQDVERHAEQGAAQGLGAGGADGVGRGLVALRLRFCARPVRLLGAGRVTGVEVERMLVDADGSATGTGERDVIPADLVIRSVGYRGLALPGLAVDEATGTVPHVAGRVLREGVVAPGEYVAGWIKRGPTGVVGTNKADAHETVASLLADVADGVLAPAGEPPDLVGALGARGVGVVLMTHWVSIDDAEQALGARFGRDRTTIHERADLLAAARVASRVAPSG